MANYCSNNIAFYSSDKTLLQNLHNIMLDVFNNSKCKSVYEILLKHGYSKEEAEKISDRRDYLSYMEFELTDKRCGYYAFKAETESAWQPNMTSFFQLLLDKYDNKISLVYVAEEPGSCIFDSPDQIKEKVREEYITKDTYHNFYMYLDRFTCNYEMRWQ